MGFPRSTPLLIIWWKSYHLIDFVLIKIIIDPVITYFIALYFWAAVGKRVYTNVIRRSPFVYPSLRIWYGDRHMRPQMLLISRHV